MRCRARGRRGAAPRPRRWAPRSGRRCATAYISAILHSTVLYLLGLEGPQSLISPARFFPCSPAILKISLRLKIQMHHVRIWCRHSPGRFVKACSQPFATIVPHLDLKRVRDHAEYKKQNVINRRVDCDVGFVVKQYQQSVLLGKELDDLRARENHRGESY